MKCILIVDDEEKYRAKFAHAVADMGLDVLVASDRESAERLIAEKKPTIATVDYSIAPGYTGNDVARAIRKVCQDARIAGISGGDLTVFDISLVDVLESKSGLDEERYAKIVDFLLHPEDPEKHYRSVAALTDDVSDLNALYILVQGYCAARKLLRGEQPVPGRVLRVPPKEEVDSLLDVRRYGLTAKKLYQSLTFRDLTLKSDPKLQAFFDQIDSNEIVEEALAAHAEAILERIL
jgi:CheY-like chemotaxis protein